MSQSQSLSQPNAHGGPTRVTFTVKYLIKLDQHGWRQHKLPYVFSISSSRSAFMLRVSSGADRPAPVEMWSATMLRGWCSVVPLQARKCKIVYDVGSGAQKMFVLEMASIDDASSVLDALRLIGCTVMPETAGALVAGGAGAGAGAGPSTIAVAGVGAGAGAGGTDSGAGVFWKMGDRMQEEVATQPAGNVFSYSAPADQQRASIAAVSLAGHVAWREPPAAPAPSPAAKTADDENQAAPHALAAQTTVPLAPLTAPATTVGISGLTSGFPIQELAMAIAAVLQSSSSAAASAFTSTGGGATGTAGWPQPLLTSTAQPAPRPSVARRDIAGIEATAANLIAALESGAEPEGHAARNELLSALFESGDTLPRLADVIAKALNK